jgi:hypothetical protein
VNQELIEENGLLAIDRQHLQAAHEQLDLAITRRDQYTDQLKWSIKGGPIKALLFILL